MTTQPMTTQPMTLTDALAYLNSFKTYGTKLGLERMRALCRALGDPQKDLNFVHIAGTNGKGSTASFCYHMLKAQGYKTGLFTSPYLQRFNERMVVSSGVSTDQGADRQISDAQLVEFISQIKALMDTTWGDYFDEQPTWFELLTGIAFLFFKAQDCDLVVLEVGLGGDLDSTNVIEQSLVSIITVIGYDHMDVLGSTLELIAAKKAGIIKPQGRVVVYPQAQAVTEVIVNRGREQQATLRLVDGDSIRPKQASLAGQIFDFGTLMDLSIQMLGSHQVTNASVAVAAMEELPARGYPMSEAAIRLGLQQATWPGRLEIMTHEPLLLIDGAHNTQGTANLSHNLRLLQPNTQWVFIVGVLRDKDYNQMLADFDDLGAYFITVTPDQAGRALPATELAAVIADRGHKVQAATSVSDAIARAQAIATAQQLPICAFGSLYYIGQIREHHHLT